MNTNKLIVASLLGGVTYFFMGWLVYGIVLRPLTAMPSEIASVVEFPEEEFKMSLMILSCIVYSGLLSYIFLKWAGISTFISGAKAGATIGVLISLSVGLSMASMYRISTIETTLFNGVGELVCSAIVGGVIGWVLGRGQ